MNNELNMNNVEATVESETLSVENTAPTAENETPQAQEENTTIENAAKEQPKLRARQKPKKCQ